jgi:hypothetical protein
MKDKDEGLGARLLAEIGPVRVINLGYRADRRAEVAEELGRFGLALGEGRVRLFPAVRPDEAGPFESIGARGCFVSHLGALRDALRDGAESLLILEDDVAFCDSRGLAAALAGLQDVDWSIFYGGYDAVDGIGSTPVAVVDHATPILTAHCVAFRRPAIAALVPYLEAMLSRPAGSPRGGPMHVDGAYSWFRREHPSFVTALANPPIAHQRSSRTDIHALGLKDRLPIVRDLVGYARRIMR